MEELKFGIKKITLGDGTTKFIPVIKKEHSSILKFFSTWERIVLVDNTYYTEGLLVDEIDFTIEKCKEYIQGYREQIKREYDKKVINEEVIEV